MLRIEGTLDSAEQRDGGVRPPAAAAKPFQPPPLAAVQIAPAAPGPATGDPEHPVGEPTSERGGTAEQERYCDTESYQHQPILRIVEIPDRQCR